MNAKLKKKMCWNCDATLASHEEHCSLCGVYQNSESMGESEVQNNLYAPPYKSSSLKEAVQQNIPNSPYSFTKDEEVTEPESKEVEALNDPLLPTMLLIGGSVLFIFSLALYLFSHNGILTLQWNAKMWFIYTILGMGMLIFGWYKSTHLSEK